MDIVKLFCEIDDFSYQYEKEIAKRLINKGEKTRERKTTLCLSEVMTIIVTFHSSAYRTFKDYYTRYVCKELKWAFPQVISYNRFVELILGSLLALACFLETRKGSCMGISFIDSTKIAVCHNLRINSNKVFAGKANRAKTSVGWFYGFKLHLVINDCEELLAFSLTKSNVDNRTPVEKMTKALFGKLFGDRGYISQHLFELLFNKGLQLITKIRSKMKNKLIPLVDKILLRKRSIIETVNDQLKNISQLEHSRHRSVANFLVNILACLISYSFRDKLPSLNIFPSYPISFPLFTL